MAESTSVQDTESFSLLISLVFWQLTVPFVKELFTRKRNSMESGQRAKKLLQFPGQGMDFSAISPYLVQPGLNSMNVMCCLQACLLYSFLPVLQVFARVISVLQSAKAVKVKVGLSISEHYIPM